MDKTIKCAPVKGTRPSARYDKKIILSSWPGNYQAAMDAGLNGLETEHAARLMDHST